MYGWAGKVLHVDLTENRIWKEPFPEELGARFLGRERIQCSAPVAVNQKRQDRSIRSGECPNIRQRTVNGDKRTHLRPIDHNLP